MEYIGAIVLLILVVWVYNLKRGKQPKWDGGRIVNIPGPGTYSIDVVGESFYQYALEQICGGKTEDGHKRVVTAFLICEDKNPYDNKAVAVTIHGHMIGHLSRENARQCSVSKF